MRLNNRILQKHWERPYIIAGVCLIVSLLISIYLTLVISSLGPLFELDASSVSELLFMGGILLMLIGALTKKNPLIIAGLVVLIASNFIMLLKYSETGNTLMGMFDVSDVSNAITNNRMDAISSAICVVSCVLMICALYPRYRPGTFLVPILCSIVAAALILCVTLFSATHYFTASFDPMTLSWTTNLPLAASFVLLGFGWRLKCIVYYGPRAGDLPVCVPPYSEISGLKCWRCGGENGAELKFPYCPTCGRKIQKDEDDIGDGAPSYFFRMDGTGKFK